MSDSREVQPKPKTLPKVVEPERPRIAEKVQPLGLSTEIKADFYGRLGLVDEMGRISEEVPSGESSIVAERWSKKVDYYNGVFNVGVQVRETPGISSFGVRDGLLLIKPGSRGMIRNEDFLLMHECVHEKQRLLFGFKTRDEMVTTFVDDFSAPEIGASDWASKYTMPPFVMSDADRRLIFGYYGTEDLRKSVAMGIRDIHSDVMALRHRKNTYMSDEERKFKEYPDEKFLLEFKHELEFNAAQLDSSDPASFQQRIRDRSATDPSFEYDLVRKVARFTAVAGGAEKVVEPTDYHDVESGIDPVEYGVIATRFDSSMKNIFGEDSQQYKVFNALRRTYQNYFINCTRRTDLMDYDQVITGLDSTNETMRARVSEFLGEMGDVRALDRLLALGKDESLMVRLEALRSVHEIMRRNPDNSEVCSERTITRLLSIGDNIPEHYLYSFSTGNVLPLPQMFTSALTKSLIRLGPRGARALDLFAKSVVKMLDDPTTETHYGDDFDPNGDSPDYVDYPVRQKAVFILSSMGKHAIPYIIEAIDKGDYEKKWRCSIALGLMEEEAKDQIPLLERLAKEDDKEGFLVANANWALGKIYKSLGDEGNAYKHYKAFLERNPWGHYEVDASKEADFVERYKKEHHLN